ncbi:PAS domain S-box protein [Autumnicola psychrophila]|uniref:histidine kinase n=1 Tax=Autumnicola psychrophila TaxID=3075592 RepID=A0ABU3DMK2_9FLAO|nr:PAS domain S-box protein [Zunongwangia sp. F225]MDT0684931.1 PAS domain S-box protein [Zunongwangia sp. F225]
MIKPSIPVNDLERVHEVYKYDPNNTLEESDLDFLSAMAAEICNTNTALITLIARDKQWIKSSYGIELEVREFPREFTFCAHTINNPNKVTVVPDASKDDRFKNNPFVTGEEPVIFYAGVPLVNSNGYALGTICAIDSKSKNLSKDQEGKLQMLSRQVMKLLELRRKSRTLEDANRSLNTINNRFRYVTEGTETGIFEWDTRSDEVSFNKEWWKITGYSDSTEEKKLNFWKNLVHHDDLENFYNHLAQHFESRKRFKFQFRLKHLKGHYIWINIKGRFFSHKDLEKPARMYGILQEITENKKKEYEIFYRKKLLDALYELSPIGLALNDFETGAFLEVNNKLLEPTGYSREEFLDLSYWDVTPKDYEVKESEQISSLNQVGFYGPYEKEYIKKNGERYPVLLNGILVKDIDGNKRIWSFVEDISERKQDEQIKANWLKRIEELLSVTNGQNERLKNFAHIVSHNLRSHSSAIGLLVGFLENEHVLLKENETFTHLQNASLNLEGTIRDLNEIVEINLSEGTNVTTISVEAVVKKTIESVHALAKTNKTSIIIDLEPDLKVVGVRPYLESIILNFLTNGIKYSSLDRKSFVKITGKKVGKFTVLTFKDNGLGIDLERHKDRLFKMYKTFHKHEDARGIGLFITKNQIEAMNGSVEVESEVNKGTIFKVFLPDEKN